MLAFNPAFVSALLVLAALAGILIYQFRQTPNAPQVVKDTQPSPVPAFTPQQPETSLSPEEKSIEKPDNRKPIRQPEAKPSPEKSPRRIAPKIAPPSQEMAVQPNSKPSNAPEVVRVPIYEKPNRTPDEDSSTVRNGNRRVAVGNALNEIKFLYVEIVGDEDFAGEIKAKLQSERFIITENAEIADAALKITLRRNSDGQTAVANVRIVNANGFVIYPNRKNVTGWKYKGKRATLLPRIARDLVRARDSANQKK